MPEPIARDTVFRETAVAGHHGNPIILFEAKLEDRQTLPQILKHIGSKLTALDKETLSEKLKLHLEKGNLYLRFDKQQAFLGASRLSSNDPIHFKIHFKNRTSDQIIDICKESGLLP